MSILIILGAATLLAAPYEAYSARRNIPRVKVYRKPDPPKGIRKARQPSTTASFNATHNHESMRAC